MENDQVENKAAAETNNILNEEAMMLDQFVYASTGQRFLNYLIDNLVMRFGISVVSSNAINLVLAATNSTIFSNAQTNVWALFGLSYLISMLNYSLYYVICEKLFNGYTLGKLITGTRAIREDGAALTIKDVALRTLCRFVPFEPFSGFKTRPWHDEWSHTMVVKVR